MKIIIIGLGTIGRTILRSLSGEGHTVTIIDENKDVIERMIERIELEVRLWYNRAHCSKFSHNKRKEIPNGLYVNGQGFHA